ncbi:hypothetical protein E8E14_004863 [Neopestalotiopsis sp. 37M]|nr:hypothetical protein E8E14_004863 [Neopestalotiopsis sp. 37M]
MSTSNYTLQSIAAWEARQKGRQNAREVGNLKSGYTPSNLSTYKSRGINSFKAPNPNSVRFQLPGESKTVYPGDSPVRQSTKLAAKRTIDEIATPNETEPSTSKRQKVLPTPLQPKVNTGSSTCANKPIVAKRSYRQFAASDDLVKAQVATPAYFAPSSKRQKVHLSSNHTSNESGLYIRANRAPSQPTTSAYTTPPNRHKQATAPVDEPASDSDTDVSIAGSLSPVKSEEEFRAERFRPSCFTSGQTTQIDVSLNTFDINQLQERLDSQKRKHFQLVEKCKADTKAFQERLNSRKQSLEQSPVTRPSLQSLSTKRVEHTKASLATSAQKTGLENSVSERPRVRYLTSRRLERLSQPLLSTSIEQQGVRRPLLRTSIEQKQPLLPLRRTSLEYQQAYRSLRKTSLEQRQALRRSSLELQELRQSEAQLLQKANAQAIEQAHHQEWRFSQAFLAILLFVMAIINQLWTVGTSLIQKLFTPPQQLFTGAANHDDSAREESATSKNTETAQVLPGSFPNTNEHPPQAALQSPELRLLDDASNDANQNGTLPEEQDTAINRSTSRNIPPADNHTTPATTSLTSDTRQHEETTTPSSTSHQITSTTHGTASARDIHESSDANPPKDTSLSRSRSLARKYSDSSEEWQNHDAARRQLCHEAFDRNYIYETDRVLAKDKYRTGGLTTAQNLECVQKASVFSKASRPRPRTTYRNPRKFFDDEDNHSLPYRGRASLEPNHHKLEEDDQVRAAREKKEQELAEQKRFEEADARLRGLGLSAARAPVIININGKWEDRVQSTKSTALKPIKTCPPEPLEFGQRDFLRLVPDRVWLNDSCIQAATQYAADYINRAAGVTLKKDTPKCVALNSFFWNSLVSSGVSGKERMLKRVWGLTPQNFLDVESLIIPINAHQHWTFVFVRPQRREIAYVDSFQSQDQNRIDKVLAFVAAFLGPLFKEDEWKQVSFRVPVQSNSYDCGMFVITNSLLLSLGLDPSGYREIDMVRQRINIAAMIINGGYHGDFDLAKLLKL